MCRRRRPWVVALTGLVVATVGCAALPPGETPEVTTRHAHVPAIPLPPVPSMRVDPDLVELAACAECDRPGGPDRDRFFSGRLALGALDALAQQPDRDDRSAQGGNLLLSGYFGGLQLRGVLGSIGAREAGPASPLLDLVGRSALGGLDAQVGSFARIAADGSDAAVRRAMADLLPVLALLYGYNLGYLQVALERPPIGAAPPEGRIECPTPLSCRSPSLRLDAADRFSSTFQRLESPPDPRWTDTARLTHALVTASVPGGRAVWDQLLDGDGFDARGYAAIVDLSGAFLEVASVALAGATEAASGGEVDLARRSLALTAGLVAWAGSYFLGLASPLDDTELPQLHCGAAAP